MKKKIVMLLAGLSTMICLSGCTEQSMSRDYGGDMTLELPVNQKLEEITWKEDSLWYLTRPMRENEEAEIHIFQQSSSWGLIEGTVTVVEKKEVNSDE